MEMTTNRNHWGADVFTARSNDKKVGYIPASPNDQERRVYETKASEFLKSRDDLCVVMGMTPTVREVAHSLTDNVVCLDKSKDAIDFLQDVIPVEYQRRERVVNDDWTRMPEVVGQVPKLVMGDGVFGNLLDDEGQNEILAAINRTLPIGGGFISRCIVKSDHFPLDQFKVDVLLQLLRDGEIDEGEFGHGMRVWSQYDSPAYDPETYLLDNKIVYAEFNKMKDAGKISDYEMEVLNRYYFSGYHFYPPQSYWDRIVQNNGFQFEVEWLQGKIYTQYLPIYVCRKTR